MAVPSGGGGRGLHGSFHVLPSETPLLPLVQKSVEASMNQAEAFTEVWTEGSTNVSTEAFATSPEAYTELLSTFRGIRIPFFGSVYHVPSEKQ